MGKKFLNKSKGTISFGHEIVVQPGAVVELDDKVIEETKAAIENLIKTGELVEGTGETHVPKAEPEIEETKSKKKNKAE